MTDRPDVPVVPLREAAALLGVSTRAAESALRHAGIKSGYPLAAVEWLRDNRPGRGARTDLKETEMISRTRATEIAKQLNGMRGSEHSGSWLAYDQDGDGGNHIHTSPAGLGSGVVAIRIPSVGDSRLFAGDVLAAFRGSADEAVDY